MQELVLGLKLKLMGWCKYEKQTSHRITMQKKKTTVLYNGCHVGFGVGIW